MQRSICIDVNASSPQDLGTTDQRYTIPCPKFAKHIARSISIALDWTGNSSQSLPQHTSQTGVVVGNSIDVGYPPQKSLHMMSCMQCGLHRRVVHQDRIDHISTDRALFCFIRRKLAQRRGRFRQGQQYSATEQSLTNTNDSSVSGQMVVRRSA
jgi:hypothetical protein